MRMDFTRDAFLRLSVQATIKLLPSDSSCGNPAGLLSSVVAMVCTTDIEPSG